MKLFISQPMRGKTDEEISTRRNEIIAEMKEEYGEDLEVIESFVPLEGAPEGCNRPLWYLGRSLQFLSQADIAYFDTGYKEARGCAAEYACAVSYGIQIIISNQ